MRQKDIDLLALGAYNLNNLYCIGEIMQHWRVALWKNLTAGGYYGGKFEEIVESSAHYDAIRKAINQWCQRSGIRVRALTSVKNRSNGSLRISFELKYGYILTRAKNHDHSRRQIHAFVRAKKTKYPNDPRTPSKAIICWTKRITATKEEASVPT